VDNSGKVQIDIPLSITFLADFLGAPRETTSRVCKSLVERGLITMDKKIIVVNNMSCMAKFYQNHCGEDCICQHQNH
jgi:predicted component of type VI protein secretion system